MSKNGLVSFHRVITPVINVASWQLCYLSSTEKQINNTLVDVAHNRSTGHDFGKGCETSMPVIILYQQKYGPTTHLPP